MSAQLIDRQNVHRLPDESAIAIFHHIPKCGGTTLERVLVSAYGAENSSHYDHYTILPNLDGIKYISGHGCGGVHTLFPDTARAFYITFIRHPLNIAISHYKYTRDQMLLPAGQTLENYLYNFPQNFLIRYLGNGEYQRARKNLFENYAFYGVQEYYEESMNRLADMLPFLNGIAYQQVNVSSKYEHTISEQFLEIFNKKHAEDILLYTEAVEVFFKTSSANKKNTRQLPPEYLNTPEAERNRYIKNKEYKKDGKNFYDPFHLAVLAIYNKNFVEAAELVSKLDKYSPLFEIVLYEALSFHKKTMEACLSGLHVIEHFNRDGDVLFMGNAGATMLAFLCRAFYALHPDMPFPEQYGTWLKRYAKFESSLDLLEFCSTRQGDALLQWYLEYASPDEQDFPENRARAHILLARYYARCKDASAAGPHAQAALQYAPWNIDAALLLAANAPDGGLDTVSFLAPYFGLLTAYTPLQQRALYGHYTQGIPAYAAGAEVRHAIAKARGIDWNEQFPEYTALQKNSLQLDGPVLIFLDTVAGLLETAFAGLGGGGEFVLCPSTKATGDYENFARQKGWTLGPRLEEDSSPAAVAHAFSEQGLPCLYQTIFCITHSPQPSESFFTHYGRVFGFQAPVYYTFYPLAPDTFFCRNLLQHEQFQRLRSNGSFAVWGTGGRFKNFLEPQLINSNAVPAYYIETAPVQGKIFQGLPVLSPGQAANQPVELVLVASCEKESICETAKQCGLGPLFFV